MEEPCKDPVGVRTTWKPGSRRTSATAARCIPPASTAGMASASLTCYAFLFILYFLSFFSYGCQAPPLTHSSSLRGQPAPTPSLLPSPPRSGSERRAGATEGATPPARGAPSSARPLPPQGARTDAQSSGCSPGPPAPLRQSRWTCVHPSPSAAAFAPFNRSCCSARPRPPDRPAALPSARPRPEVATPPVTPRPRPGPAPQPGPPLCPRLGLPRLASVPSALDCARTPLPGSLARSPPLPAPRPPPPAPPPGCARPSASRATFAEAPTHSHAELSSGRGLAARCPPRLPPHRGPARGPRPLGPSASAAAPPRPPRRSPAQGPGRGGGGGARLAPPAPAQGGGDAGAGGPGCAESGDTGSRWQIPTEAGGAELARRDPFSVAMNRGHPGPDGPRVRR